MSEEEIIDIIVAELANADNATDDLDRLRDRARTLYARIKRKEQRDRMPLGRRRD